MAIIQRKVMSIARQRKVKVDLTGGGHSFAELTPRHPRTQYLVLIIGEIERDQPVTAAEVAEATRALLSACGRS